MSRLKKGAICRGDMIGTDLFALLVATLSDSTFFSRFKVRNNDVDILRKEIGMPTGIEPCTNFLPIIDIGK